MDGTDLVGLDYCYVTTAGRSSGRPHTIEIWFCMPIAIELPPTPAASE